MTSNMDGGQHHGPQADGEHPAVRRLHVRWPTRPVAAATAAALGVLTPMPCIPNTPAPWVPGSPTVMVQNFPALNESSKLMCIWAGVISITLPGQVTQFIP